MSDTQQIEKTPLWIILISFLIGLPLCPIGTIFFTCALHLDFFGCLKLIGLQLIAFLALVFISGFKNKYE